MAFVNVLMVLSAVLTISSGIFTPEQTSEIETFVKAVMACRQIPGLGLAVVKGEETWTMGFGDEDRAKGIKVTPDTLFGIGSVTKAFTGTLLGMLIEDSGDRITWTSKVKDILGSDFAFIDDERTKETTLRDLLSHRTGLANLDLLFIAGFNKSGTEFVKRIRFLPEVRAFRDGFHYNNLGYGLAGHIVEVLSGDSWTNTLEKRIFKPLGMTRSSVFGKTVETSDEGVAKPYYNVDNKVVLTDPDIYRIAPMEAAGAMASSANDMAQWLHFLLREGKNSANRELMTANVLKDTFGSYVVASELMDIYAFLQPQYPASEIPYGYGYGWVASTYRGVRSTMHHGGLHSYGTVLRVFPDNDFGVFSSANGVEASEMITGERMINFFISDMLLGEEPWLNTSTACSFPSPWAKIPTFPPDVYASPAGNAPALCVECYVGTYGHYLYGDVQVKFNEQSESLEMVYGKMEGTLKPSDVDTKFWWDLSGVYRFLSHSGNDTYLVTVHFDKLQNGKYQLIDNDFDTKMVFSRSVSFFDSDIFTAIETPPKTNGQGKTNVNCCTMMIVVALALTMLKTCIA